MTKSTMHHDAVPKTPLKKGPRASSPRELDLRERLVRAAAEIVDREGAKAVTLRAVGDLADVSRQAPYLHFPDREALLAAVAAQGLWELHALLEQAARGADSPLSALKGLAAGYVDYAAKHPHRFRLIFGDEIADRARHPELARAGHAVQATLEAPLGRAAFELPHAQAEAALAQLTAWSVVHGLAYLVVDARTDDLGFARVPPKALAESVAELLTRAVIGGAARATATPAKSSAKKRARP